MSTIKSQITAKASKKLQEEIDREIVTESEQLDLMELLNENTKRDDRNTGDRPDTKDC